MKISNSLKFSLPLFSFIFIFLNSFNSFALNPLILEGHSGWLRAIATTEDRIYSVADDATLREWFKTDKGWKNTILHSFSSTDYLQNNIHSSGKRLTTASVHGDFYFFSLKKEGNKMLRLDESDCFGRVNALHENASVHVASSAGIAKLYYLNHADSDQLNKYHLSINNNDIITAITISNEGNYVLLGSRLGYVYLFENENTELIPKEPIRILEQNINLLLFSQDKAWLLLTEEGNLYTFSLADNSISPLALNLSICSFIFSSDHNYLFAGTKRGELIVWRHENNEFIQINKFEKAHKSYVMSLALFNDSLASASFDKTIKLWKLSELVKQH